MHHARTDLADSGSADAGDDSPGNRWDTSGSSWTTSTAAPPTACLTASGSRPRNQARITCTHGQ